MQPVTVKQRREQITFPGLPLAIYREIAAHLRQVKDIKTGLIPQTSSQFDYYQSQVGGLWIESPCELEAMERQQVEDILTYYAQHYGSWQRDLK